MEYHYQYNYGGLIVKVRKSGKDYEYFTDDLNRWIISGCHSADAAFMRYCFVEMHYEGDDFVEVVREFATTELNIDVVLDIHARLSACGIDDIESLVDALKHIIQIQNAIKRREMK